MGWTPRLRYRADRGRFYCRLDGRQHDLGADYDTALRRFHALLTDAGQTPAAPARPLSVAGLVHTWQQTHPGRFAAEMTRPFAEWAAEMSLSAIRADTLAAYAATLKARRLAAETIVKYIRYARRVLAHAHGLGWLTVVPDQPKLPRPVAHPKDLDRETFQNAFKALRTNDRRHAYYIFVFIAETGCRPPEARNLDWADVRENGRLCVLDRHKTDRHGRVRVIVCNPRARAVLRLVGRLWGREGPVFRSRLGRPYTASGLRAIARRVGFHPYQLRHTWAQWSTLPDALTAEALGHADLRMLKVYRHIKPRALLDALSAASPLTRPGPRVPPPPGRPSDPAPPASPATRRSTPRRSAKPRRH